MVLARLLTTAIAALIACEAHAASHRGPIERDTDGTDTTLHRAVCSGDRQPGHMHCHAHVMVHPDGTPHVHAAGTIGITPQGYGPADLRKAYAFTPTGGTTTTIAVVDAYGYPTADRDLAVYRTTFGLPACRAATGCLTVLNQRGGTDQPPQDTGWSQEQALDLAMVSAMCPNCRIVLIETDDDSIDNLTAGVALAVGTGAIAISNSYGGTEAGSAPYARFYRHPGIAITASSGDEGYGAEFPASAPGTIAVGGTRLTVDPTSPRGWRETAWTKGGSGCSALYPKPAWQDDTVCLRRTVSDVAAVAAPATGVAVYGPTGVGGGSGWMVFGGTSAGAPLIAAMYAAGGNRPVAAKLLWQRRSTLNDVTQGSNGSCGGTYLCNAGPGYDGPTGNGTPQGRRAF